MTDALTHNELRNISRHEIYPWIDNSKTTCGYRLASVCCLENLLIEVCKDGSQIHFVMATVDKNIITRAKEFAMDDTVVRGRRIRLTGFRIQLTLSNKAPASRLGFTSKNDLKKKTTFTPFAHT